MLGAVIGGGTVLCLPEDQKFGIKAEVYSAVRIGELEWNAVKRKATEG